MRNTLICAMGALILTVVGSRAAAQALPELPQAPRILVPQIEGLPPEFQQEFERLQQEIDQIFQQGGLIQPNRRQPAASSGMRWGGLQLKKVNAEEQEKLGLPEKEGLEVAAVDANSVAAQAGLKAKDILVKVNDKAVPSDAGEFAKLVKDMNADAIDVVVLREGKEETIKGAKMPALVQMPSTARPQLGFGGLGGLGGFGGLGGMKIQPLPLQIPGARIGGRVPFQDGLMGKPQNLNMEMMVNGAKITKKQQGNDFSGSYVKDELRINVVGKLENGVAKTSEITVQQGKDTAKYGSLNEVPVQHRVTVQQLMPATVNNFLFPFELLRDLQELQGLPLFPMD
jgi:membrane-associated protease RseP (regulator of RpoE activity)